MVYKALIVFTLPKSALDLILCMERDAASLMEFYAPRLHLPFQLYSHHSLRSATGWMHVGGTG